MLKTYFVKYGEVEKCHIHTKPNNFKYAFLTFQEAHSAAKALSNKTHRILRRSIKVTAADSWHQSDPQLSEEFGTRRAFTGKSSSSSGVDAADMPNQTGTYLMDINDDCLIEILYHLSLDDLCSAAETCPRMLQCAAYVFNKSWKEFICHDLNMITVHETRRYLVNFAPWITEVEMMGYQENKNKTNRQFDMLTRYCTGTLEKISLVFYEADRRMAMKLQTLFASMKRISLDGCNVMHKASSVNMFANCTQLEELKIHDANAFVNKMVFNSTFRTLKSLKLKKNITAQSNEILSVRHFIGNHPQLTELHLRAYDLKFYEIFGVIASGLVQLENLCICGQSANPDEYIKHLQKLTELKHLKVLTLNCEKKSLAAFLNESESVATLESLELHHTIVDAEFFASLTKYQHLTKLTLRESTIESDLINLKALPQLTHLGIKQQRCHYKTSDNFVTSKTVLDLVEQLPKLTQITMGPTYKLDDETYMKLVEIVAGHPQRPILEYVHFGCNNFDIESHKSGNNRSIVKYVENDDCESSVDDYDDTDDDSYDDDSDYDYDVEQGYDSDDFYMYGEYFGYDSDDSNHGGAFGIDALGAFILF